jgi:hypothetical protein
MNPPPTNICDFLGEVKTELKAPSQQVMQGPSPVLDDDADDFVFVQETPVIIQSV